MTEDPTVEQPPLISPPPTSPPPSSSPPGLSSKTPVYSKIRSFSVVLMIIGTILLFISLGDCTHFFLADRYDGPFITYCGGGCFLIIQGLLILAQTDYVEYKAKLEKMNDEEKQLYIKEKKDKDAKLATQLFIIFLITLFTIIILIP